jgi:ATP-dependent Clp protease ATP-binding subunit ClpA
MFERFTERARQVVVLAQDEARTLKHNYIGTEHILLGLLREEEGLAARVLHDVGLTFEEVRAQVVTIVGQGDTVVTGQIPFTPRAKKVLELALREALSFDHQYVAPEHIVLGLVREYDGVAARVLGDLGTDADSIRAEVIHRLGMSGPGRSAEVPQTPGARSVLRLAQDEARDLGHNHVGTEHILLGLLGEEEGGAAHVLAVLGVTIAEVRAQVAKIVVQGDDDPGDEIRLTPAASRVVELAAAEALSLGQSSISTEHLLLGLVRQDQGIAVRILLDFDVDAEKVRNEIGRRVSASERTETHAGRERFTERARQVVVLAGDEARAFKHDAIGTEHILLGLLREEEGLAARVLDTFDITVEEVRAQVARIVGVGDEVATGKIPFTPRTKHVFQLALREALSLGHNYIGTEHLLLGLVRENEGVGARILGDFDADAEKIRGEIIRILSGPGRRRRVSRGPVVVSLPCPACVRSLEQLQLTHQEGDTFTADRSGAAHCRHCDARFDLSYRIEWKPA